MRTYGLVGYPLGHSFSRKFFTEKFSIENRNEQYLNFEIDDICRLPSVIREYPELAGFNVTIPYKERVISFLDRMDQVAEEIGAVNTVRIQRGPEGYVLEGFNTDASGFLESLRPFLTPERRSALILGTGGASKAVCYVFNLLGIKWISVSRDPVDENTVSYGQITPALMEEHLLIINTTPLGTYPQTSTFPDIPYSCLTPRHLLYDLVYNPAETVFLSLGREKGAETKNGLEMLEIQALKSYEIWNEKTK